MPRVASDLLFRATRTGQARKSKFKIRGESELRQWIARLWPLNNSPAQASPFFWERRRLAGVATVQQLANSPAGRQRSLSAAVSFPKASKILQKPIALVSVAP